MDNLISKIDDDGKLLRKYRNKCYNAKKEGLKCELTFEEYIRLVNDAGLKSSDLGFTGKKYVLARIGDTGNYKFGNCRFITQKENVHEKVLTEKAIRTSKNNIKKAIEKNKSDTNIGTKISEGIKNSKKCQEIKENQMIKREQKRANMHPSFIGDRNSQYGTFWITDGKINKKWKLENGELPNGFKKGRICNYK